MGPIFAVLSAPAARLLLEEAGRLGGRGVVPAALTDPPAAVAARAEAGLLVHDFVPDADRSLHWLELGAAARDLRVFALLKPPVSEVAHAVVSAPRRFRLVGLATTEVSPRWLSARLADLDRIRVGEAVLRALDDATGGDPVLALLARRELLGVRHHRTLEKLLRESGIGRKRFVRHARAAGFDPPLRFLHLLRVAKGVALLREGRTVHEVMEWLGYGSEATLRQHFREVVGRTPGEVRRMALEALTGEDAGALVSGRRRPAP